MNLDDNTDENEKRLLKSIPLDKEISTYLPNISDIIETKYNKEKKEYIYDINLQKGFPGGKQKIKLVIYQINNFNTLPFLSYLLYKYNETEDSEEHLTLPMPVQKVLKRTHDFGYNHHIERLMVLGNWFLLNSYNPESVYKWFSAMYVDAYEWVMVPNVIGMSQYADGGKVATKPYISGGNYLSKMGRWGDATSGLDEFTRLYWEFLSNNYDKLKTNPRMSLVLKLSIDKQ